MIDTFANRDEDDKVRMIPRISWGAIIAGAVAAIAVSVLLNLLGVGVGFTTIDPLSEAQPLSGLGTATVVWWIISNIIALFIGGAVAGRMAGFVSKEDGGLHGFLSWCLYAAVSIFFFVSLVASIISGITGTVSSIVGGGQNQEIVIRIDNQQQSNQQQQDFFSNIRSEVMQLINQAEQYNILPENASENVNQVMSEAIAEMLEVWQELNLDRNIAQFFNDLHISFVDGNLKINVEGEYLKGKEIKSYLIQNTDLSAQEIEQMINEWNQTIDQAINQVEQLYQQAKQKLEAFSDELAATIATICLISFFSLLLSAIAACGGGILAAKLNPARFKRSRPERIG